VLVLTIAGLLMELCLVGMALLQDLSEHMTAFLVIFGTAGLSYVAAVFCILKYSKDRGNSLPLIWGLAILFRVTLLLTTPPTLSSDVYRYIWDGRIMNAGVNPYAHAVDSPLLDPFDSPQRSLVNHSWMASPYLPAAQGFFAAVYRLCPESPLAFQIAAVLLDLLTGWLVIDVLRRLGLPRTRALIYLWNPLVVVEFAHGAHVDALMICLIMAVFWSLVVRASVVRRSWLWRLASTVSVMTLAAATLTKGLPVLLLPAVARRLGWRQTAVTLGLVIAVCVPFGLGAGWGLVGPLNGEGLFGALRIYTAYWRFNAGVYHWLEAALSYCWSLGAATLGMADWVPVVAARMFTLVALGWVLIAVWRLGRMTSTKGRLSDTLALLRLAIIPLAAYLLLATTVHPWYVTVLIPLFPFLQPREGEATRTGRWLWPGLYFSVIVSLSYLTYLDPASPRENNLVRLTEYVPLYLLLMWSACGSFLDTQAGDGSASSTGQ